MEGGWTGEEGKHTICCKFTVTWAEHVMVKLREGERKREREYRQLGGIYTCCGAATVTGDGVTFFTTTHGSYSSVATV